MEDLHYNFCYLSNRDSGFVVLPLVYALRRDNLSAEDRPSEKSRRGRSPIDFPPACYGSIRGILALPDGIRWFGMHVT